MGDDEMNYETATNAELNKRLSELLKMVVEYDAYMEPTNLNYEDLLASHVNQEGNCNELRDFFSDSITHLLGKHWDEYDFTSDYGATLSLCHGYCITLIPVVDGYAALYMWDKINITELDYMDDIHSELVVDGEHFIFQTDRDALRAAVICLIKVIEDEHIKVLGEE